MPVRVLCWTRNAVFLEPRWNMDQSTGTKSIIVRPLPKVSGLLLRKNTCGTNVARLRISVLFVASLDRKRLGTRVPRKTRWTRGVFDKEARRKPLAFAADAVSYGI